MDVSENSGFSPKSSILIGFSIIFTIHFRGTPIFGNIQILDELPFEKPTVIKNTTRAPESGAIGKLLLKRPVCPESFGWLTLKLTEGFAF